MTHLTGKKPNEETIKAMESPTTRMVSVDAFFKEIKEELEQEAKLLKEGYGLI